MAAGRLKQLSDDAELPEIAARAALALGKTAVAKKRKLAAARGMSTAFARLLSYTWTVSKRGSGALIVPTD